MTELTAAVELTPEPADHEIRVEHRGGRAFVCLVGEIDASLRESASAAMGIALMSGLPLVVDSSAATFIDSSGVAFVLQLHLAASESGVGLTLHDPHGVLRELLDMVGMGEVIDDDV
ncbi:STAS domain-containing protein [Cellulomonas phragmiteti]|uniref:STAS domain-containing protein n=1 Tax=Cellulomonas phragmiteti TaxID=478780 RepID=A0ABQ4DQG3_9CELL|nr:STAS domain-containing protein [Cellulomonas phragmiteti]GIG41578.1 hypothetical protein Cph01nite_33400 [Cellulomonas phragmiteti]